jgi:hypothetical protein
MKKVRIIITEDGWETTIELNGKTYVDRHKRTSTGATSTVNEIENTDELPDELIEAIIGGFKEYEIMNALYNA